MARLREIFVKRNPLAPVSLLGGLLIFGSLFLMAQWATRTDSQILLILLNSSKFRREYDPSKYSERTVQVIDHA